ncbi:MAG TPA: hypothetical protein VKX17_01555 [Planctomycetota bacterium]|nr:hypothetical protein [Planctomycetota bacterium]
MNTIVRGVRGLCVLAAVAALIFTAARAETLDGVEKAISEKFDKLTSASYDMEMKADMSQAGFSMTMLSNTKYEMAKDGDKWKIRMESKTSQNMNGTKSDSTSLMVVDGQTAYSMTDTAGQKMVMKMKPDAYTKGAGGKGMIQSLKESGDVSVLPDETVDGQAAYVLEVKSKTPGASAMKYYLSKENGMTVQMLTLGADGKTTGTTKFSNIKINPSIPADHFTFTPPAGVQVMDMTKQ